NSRPRADPAAKNATASMMPNTWIGIGPMCNTSGIMPGERKSSRRPAEAPLARVESACFNARVRAVVQRVTEARVTVDGGVVGSIGRGLCVLVGVGREDTDADAERLCRKVVSLRVFQDADGRFAHSVDEVGGALLVVSQFTLYGDCRKGRRPSFSDA